MAESTIALIWVCIPVGERVNKKIERDSRVLAVLENQSARCVRPCRMLPNLAPESLSQSSLVLVSPSAVNITKSKIPG